MEMSCTAANPARHHLSDLVEMRGRSEPRWASPPSHTVALGRLR